MSKEPLILIVLTLRSMRLFTREKFFIIFCTISIVSAISNTHSQSFQCSDICGVPIERLVPKDSIIRKRGRYYFHTGSRSDKDAACENLETEWSLKAYELMKYLGYNAEKEDCPFKYSITDFSNYNNDPAIFITKISRKLKLSSEIALSNLSNDIKLENIEESCTVRTFLGIRSLEGIKNQTRSMMLTGSWLSPSGNVSIAELINLDTGNSLDFHLKNSANDKCSSSKCKKRLYSHSHVYLIGIQYLRAGQMMKFLEFHFCNTT